LPEWPLSDVANAILERALTKNPDERHQSCEALWHDLAAVQSGSDESLAAELSLLVRNNMGDWGQPTIMANSAPQRLAQAAPAVERSPSVLRFESHTPAFSSGLDTDRPTKAREQVPGAGWAPWKRLEFRSLATTATVALSAAVALGALFLAASGSGGAKAATTRQTAVSSSQEEAVKPIGDDFRARVRACRESWGSDMGVTRVELTFDAAGKLTSVRLEPREASDTRWGVCLLESAWRTDWHLPGATSLVFDPRA
jgi:hypothetical protein